MYKIGTIPISWGCLYNTSSKTPRQRGMVLIYQWKDSFLASILIFPQFAFQKLVCHLHNFVHANFLEVTETATTMCRFVYENSVTECLTTTRQWCLLLWDCSSIWKKSVERKYTDYKQGRCKSRLQKNRGLTKFSIVNDHNEAIVIVFLTQTQQNSRNLTWNQNIREHDCDKRQKVLKAAWQTFSQRVLKTTRFWRTWLYFTFLQKKT